MDRGKFIPKVPVVIARLPLMPVPHFDGSDYDPVLDHARLATQFTVIFELMKDGVKRTLREIGNITGFPEASISAQLRNNRKERFGGHTLNKQRRGRPKRGVWEYWLVLKVVH